MTTDDQKKFLDTIGSLDLMVDDTTLGSDNPLVSQLGNVAKGILLLTTLTIYLQPAAVIPCVCCSEVATIALADWDLCAAHYNLLAAPDDTDLIGAAP